MHHVTATHLFVLLMIGATQACAPSPVNPKLLENANAQWFDGGTLHAKTADEWNSAESGNRLATSGDFVASILKVSTRSKVSSMSDLKVMAIEMERCITEAVKLPANPEMPVAEVAAACGILLGY